VKPPWICSAVFGSDTLRQEVARYRQFADLLRHQIVDSVTLIHEEKSGMNMAYTPGPINYDGCPGIPILYTCYAECSNWASRLEFFDHFRGLSIHFPSHELVRGHFPRIQGSLVRCNCARCTVLDWLKSSSKFWWNLENAKRIIQPVEQQTPAVNSTSRIAN